MVCECKSMVVRLDVENRGSDDTDRNPEAEGEMGLYILRVRASRPNPSWKLKRLIYCRIVLV